MNELSSLILNAYRQGIFPMADHAQDDDFYFVDPEERGQLSILNLHIPKRLARTVRSMPYRVTVDTAFADIIDLCAQSVTGRDSTWINRHIRDVFIDFHRIGLAHSVECWDGDTLVGGVYGLALGQIFCGESMVSRARDASKIALVHLCARLHTGGFHVLDTQFENDHLAQFGCYSVPRDEYHRLLSLYADKDADFILTKWSEVDLLWAYFAARDQRELDQV